MLVMTADQDLPSRWTAATVYDDMWVDPDDDPRHVGTSPVGERETLIQYLHAYRVTLKMKCDDLIRSSKPGGLFCRQPFPC
jgi:hypothetical protein